MAKKSSRTDNVPIQNILLDTNIIQYAGSPDSSNELKKYLLELQTRNFGLAISDISKFEILRNATRKQEADIFQILPIYYSYPLSNEVLLGSSRLSTLYRDHCNLKGENILYGDLFIAATSIFTNSLILTRNRKDFPYPFFIEAEIKTLYILKSSHQTDGYTLCLLKSNYEAIFRLFALRK